MVPEVECSHNLRLEERGLSLKLCKGVLTFTAVKMWKSPPQAVVLDENVDEAKTFF